MRRANLPGAAVGVVIDGELAYAKGFGFTDASTKTAIDADSVFGIASVTKSFTAMTVLALRDDGLLSLDDTLERWVPEAATLTYPTRDAAPIAIRHLLTHTSGLPGDGVFAGDSPSEQELLASLKGLSLERAPGMRFRYSNLGYDLLGVVVSRAARRPYREVVQARILDRLGMSSSGFDAAAVPAGKLALPHLAANGVVKPITPWTWGARASSGGLLASVRDLARFAAFQLSAFPPRNDVEQGPLARSTVREAHFQNVDSNAWFPNRDVGLHIDLPIAPKEGELTFEVMSERYGYGWGVVRTCDFDDLSWHSGGGESGYGASVQLLRDHGVGVVALFNVYGGGAWVPVAKILSALQRTGALQKRVPEPGASYDAAMKRLLDVYNHWSEAEYFAMARRRPEQAAAEKEELEGYKTLHGTCTGYSLLEPDLPSGFRFAMNCERGRLTMFVRLGGDGRITGFGGTSRDVAAPPRLREIGGQLAALVAKWDDAWVRKHLAKAKPRDESLREFEDLRWSHRACKVSGTMHDWSGWKLELDCERGGPLLLALSLDPNGGDAVTRYAFEAPPGDRCPTRSRDVETPPLTSSGRR